MLRSRDDLRSELAIWSSSPRKVPPLPVWNIVTPNPYEPVSQPLGLARRRFTGGYLFFGLAIGLLVSVIATPGLMMATIDYGLSRSPGPRFATYDHELSILGIAVSESTAYAATFVVSPVLVLASMGCFWVHRNRRRQVPIQSGG